MGYGASPPSPIPSSREPFMTTEIPSSPEAQARLLSAALPYMQRYENKTIVVKYGGHAMGNPALG